MGDSATEIEILGEAISTSRLPPGTDVFEHAAQLIRDEKPSEKETATYLLLRRALGEGIPVGYIVDVSRLLREALQSKDRKTVESAHYLLGSVFDAPYLFSLDDIGSIRVGETITGEYKGSQISMISIKVKSVTGNEITGEDGRTYTVEERNGKVHIYDEPIKTEFGYARKAHEKASYLVEQAMDGALGPVAEQNARAYLFNAISGEYGPRATAAANGSVSTCLNPYYLEHYPGHSKAKYRNAALLALHLLTGAVPEKVKDDIAGTLLFYGLGENGHSFQDDPGRYRVQQIIVKTWAGFLADPEKPKEMKDRLCEWIDRNAGKLDSSLANYAAVQMLSNGGVSTAFGRNTDLIKRIGDSLRDAAKDGKSPTAKAREIIRLAKA